MGDLISRAASIDYLMTNMGWRDEDGYEVDDADEKRAIITDLVNGISAVDAIPIDFLMRYAQLPTEFAIEAWRKPQKKELKRKIRDMDKPMLFDDAVRIVDKNIGVKN